MAKVRVTFHKTDGAISAEVDGIKGEKCTDSTKFLEQLGKVTSEKTAEFFQDSEDSDVMINSNTSS